VSTLVIGVGNEYRGDDAAGVLVARWLRELHLPNLQVIESDGECTGLLASWHGAECVILLDAVRSGAVPGTIHHFNAKEESLPVSLRPGSTHALGIAEAIELAKVLEQLPHDLLVIGIEGRNFAIGASRSAAVEKAMPILLAQVLTLVQSQRPETKACLSADYE